ncbi:MAG: response regulator [Planctomycetaceae bacterium]|nr:MAG: response regulator [Planctomycetaceae bacterium]
MGKIKRRFDLIRASRYCPQPTSIIPELSMTNSSKIPNEKSPRSDSTGILSVIHDPSILSTRILLVHDNEDALDALSTILKRQGYNVYTARTPEDAVEQNVLPDVAVLHLADHSLSREHRDLLIAQWSARGTRIVTVGNPWERRACYSDAFVAEPYRFSRLVLTILEVRSQRPSRSRAA